MTHTNSPECAAGCGLAPEPGDIFCECDREAVADRRADREDEARQTGGDA